MMKNKMFKIMEKWKSDGLMEKHYIECLNKQSWGREIGFDVSYLYGGDNGEIMFLFEINVEQQCNDNNEMRE